MGAARTATGRYLVGRKHTGRECGGVSQHAGFKACARRAQSGRKLYSSDSDCVQPVYWSFQTVSYAAFRSRSASRTLASLQVKPFRFHALGLCVIPPLSSAPADESLELAGCPARDDSADKDDAEPTPIRAQLRCEGLLPGLCASHVA